ncbi:DMT family transporter [Desulfosporosinus sp. BICA1-9]|uniref:DMT family transporter n=1 Tax=Desulfosporosinus sp. BICA1-9 TaxID=1531958 RepID=UPI00054B6F0A|nr:DMT family transporter [Desulfosporosinus sp. BICA1-9]KJS48541.1 MAG: membrane protein [Peptococcaceae bacterium BRH_c23]KJS89213.1 MAG: membrane protein [Desulfosporosinus sp. BICA1-9]
MMIDTDSSICPKERPRALLLLAVTATLWSLGGLLIKSVDTNPLAIAGSRSAIAVVLFLLVLKKPKLTWSYAQIGAALAYAATSILFVTATKTTTAANAVLLQFTAPIYVALFSAWLLKEKTKLLDWITIFLVMGGMVLFFLDNLSTKSILGNGIAAASGVSFALFIIFMRMQKDGSPLESVLLGNIITAAIGLPFLTQAVPDTSGWVYLMILGIVQLGIPYILFSKAIKHVTALEAILIPVIEPLLNPVWVFLLLGEAPGLLAMLGGFIVLLAVTVRCILTALPSSTKEVARSS